MVYIIIVAVSLGVGRLLYHCLRPALLVKNRRELGVKRAQLIYTDEKGSKMLQAESLNIQGKPDMIFETWGLKRMIPLEIKSGHLKDKEPHIGDVYQLGVYFILIEESYGKRPPYGKLVYANKTFYIRNTRRFRKEILQTVHQMRQMLEGQCKITACPDYTKCKHCLCKETVCEWC